MNHADTLSRILADIRSLSVVTAQDALDIVQCLAAAKNCCAVESLHDCCISLEDTISGEVRESDAADWMQERKQFGNRAELEPVPSFFHNLA